MNSIYYLIFIAMISPAAFAQSDSLKADFYSDLMLHDSRLSEQPDAELVFESHEIIGKSEFVSFNLKQIGTGPIRFLAKGPIGFTKAFQPLKTLLFISGFFTGQESVRLLGDTERTVIVGFQYPYGVSDFEKNPQTVLQLMRQTPGQIALTLRWLRQQSWVDPSNLAAVGVSLGGFFLPSALYLAQKLAAPPSHIIFVCTGTDVRWVIRSNLESYSSNVAAGLANFFAEVSAPLDPRIYLPALKGNFLTIRTDQDQVVPPASSLELDMLLPQPKVSKVIPGVHINPDQTLIIQEVKLAITSWMGL